VCGCASGRLARHVSRASASTVSRVVKNPSFFFLTTFCLRHVCLCARDPCPARREHQRPPSGDSEKKCKFWTIRLRHVCLRMCVPRVCPSEAASAPDSVRASASTVSRKTCVCVRDAVTDEKVCRVGCGEARLARHAGMHALFRAARKFDFAVGRKARCVCVCVCVCGGEGKK